MTKRVLFGVLTVAFGAFAGAFAWAFFFLMNAGINLLWTVIPNALASVGLPAVFYPLVFCTLGGLIIGLFARRFGDYPQDMNTVMAQVKATGRYEYDHLGASFFGALLPLLFGGSIGPEAGLTGVIAGLCTWVGDRLRFVGTEMRELAEAGTAAVISAIFSTPLFGMAVPVLGAADESSFPGTERPLASEERHEPGAVPYEVDPVAPTSVGRGLAPAVQPGMDHPVESVGKGTDLVPFLGDGPDNAVRDADAVPAAPKPLKVAVYVLAVAGALAMMALLGYLFGAGGGLPHLSYITVGRSELLWLIPFILVGTLAGWLFFPFGAAARWLGAKLGDRPVAKAVIAGAVLGAIGIGLPFAMFAGEAQTEELGELWTTIPAVILIVTGFAKVLTTQLCLNLGWRGGHFFPIIFAGIAIGYGLAALTGVDATFALCAVTGALVGAVMRQPIMTMVLLFLVFPVAGAPVLLLAAALAVLIPVPRSWLGR